MSTRLNANILVDAELTALLNLLAEIKLIVVAVQLALVQLVVSVKVDVLVRIAVELLAVVGCICSIAGPIMQISLAAVVGLNVAVGTTVSAIVDISAEIFAAAKGMQGVVVALQGVDVNAMIKALVTIN